MTRTDNPKRRKSASALVMAIWVIAVLSLMVISFATDALLQTKINVYTRRRVHVDHLTDAGIPVAELLLLEYQNVSDATVDEKTEELLDKDRWLLEKRALKRGGAATTGAIPVDPEDPAGGTVTVSIKPLEAKWNINMLYAGGDANYDKIWESILTRAGIPEEMSELRDAIVDSWTDWRDTDDLQTGRDGAEDEYYERLDEPYKARNGEITDLRELELVKAFADNPVLLSGGILNPDDKEQDWVEVMALTSFFDVFGVGKINVNAASREVLLSVPGIGDKDDAEEIADAIIQERESKEPMDSSLLVFGPFKDWNDLKMRTGDTSIGTEANTYLGYTPESFFEISIVGAANGVTHRVRAIAMVVDKKVKYIRWAEDP